MLTIVGLLAIGSIVFLLLHGRVGPIVALTIIPIVAALIAGFSLHEISQFFNEGMAKVMSIAAMFVFAILYFGLMQDVGLFDVLIDKMLSLTNGDVVVLSIGTVVVAAIAHLDGSGASTFLITIPALLPLYHKLKMSPYFLVLLVGLSASILNMLPWAGPLGRVATVLEIDPVKLWLPLIPVQIIAFILLILFTLYLGMRERKLIESESVESTNKPEPMAPVDEALSERRIDAQFIFNGVLTIGVIALLVSSVIPPVLVFMIGVSVALAFNFPDQHQQFEHIKKHAPSAIVMATIIFAAGIFLGVLKGSMMLNAIAEGVVTIIPSSLVPHLHLIIGFFGTPFELILNTDAYYFALFPVIQDIVSQHGVSSFSAAYAMIVGNIIGTFISPFSPALWLAIGLARLDMGMYIRYAFFRVWGFTLVVFFLCFAMGIF